VCSQWDHQLAVVVLYSLNLPFDNDDFGFIQRSSLLPGLRR
jgi:hypothetical protein